VLLAGRAWANGGVSATSLANFQVRNFQTWISGWASDTSWVSMGSDGASASSWASELEHETCIFELN